MASLFNFNRIPLTTNTMICDVNVLNPSGTTFHDQVISMDVEFERKFQSFIHFHSNNNRSSNLENLLTEIEKSSIFLFKHIGRGANTINIYSYDMLYVFAIFNTCLNSQNIFKENKCFEENESGYIGTLMNKYNINFIKKNTRIVLVEKQENYKNGELEIKEKLNIIEIYNKETPKFKKTITINDITRI